VNVDQVIDGIIAREGGYVNDSRDAGGETNFGITAATARSSGYAGAMRDMPRDFAVEIYRRRYVVAPGFDKIVPISQAIAAELVDTGVNMGPKVAAGFLQRALNAFNNQGRDYADIVADGDAGARHAAGAGGLSGQARRRRREGDARGAQRAPGRALHIPGREPRRQ
jgi:lysozyme family protein